MIYGGWYVQPYINLSGPLTVKAYYNDTSLTTWNELNAGAGLRLPLNLSGGKQYRSLTAAASFNIRSVQYTGDPKRAILMINTTLFKQV